MIADEITVITWMLAALRAAQHTVLRYDEVVPGASWPGGTIH